MHLFKKLELVVASRSYVQADAARRCKIVEHYSTLFTSLFDIFGGQQLFKEMVMRFSKFGRPVFRRLHVNDEERSFGRAEDCLAHFLESVGVPLFQKQQVPVALHYMANLHSLGSRLLNYTPHLSPPPLTAATFEERFTIPYTVSGVRSSR